MNDNEAYIFLKEYFDELFVKRNIDAIDHYLHEDYWDDDIGDNGQNHRENSKSFLKDLFKRNPSIQVEVKKVIIEDNVLTAYLNWLNQNNDNKIITMKGIGIFELKENKIIKRHTYLYYKRNMDDREKNSLD